MKTRAPQSASRRATRPPRVVIENVTPSVDAGRFAVKRLVGDRLEVGADIYKDGHDHLGARVRSRAPGERAWRVAPLTYEFDSDRWAGSLPLDRIGTWTFTIEAWPDRFATWRDELEKKAAAGVGVRSELLEGAEMVRVASRRAKGDDRTSLARTAVLLADENAPEADRVAAAREPELRARMDANVDFSEATRHEREYPVVVDRERAGFAAWYEMFPRSCSGVPGRHGTFADAARALPRIANLGFDVVYLPPIHPVGRTQRKGPNNSLTAGPGDPGSPWAIGSEAGGHTAVEPALGTLDDFDAFVRAAAGCGLEVALDYALQCSPDHPWVREHPDWFFLRPDGTIKYAENPPKKYEDIYPLNFWCPDHRELWAACRDILLFWIGHGVKTFRVDNPHTKPFAFWDWVLAEVCGRHPDAVFLAEAFTRPKRMKGLARVGFTQSYTYFTWRNSAGELRDYLTELTQPETADTFRAHFFANTPDILHEYLQQGGRPAFRIRLLLAATLSPLYGIYSGFELCENVPLRPGSEEYLDSEKYQIRVRDWNAAGHINDDVARINRIRREHPALRRATNLSFHPTEDENVLFYRRAWRGDDLLIIANLDPRRAHETMVQVPLRDLGLEEEAPFEVEDLLTGERYAWSGVRNYVRLDPKVRVGHVMRIVARP